MLKLSKRPAVRSKKCWSYPNNDALFCRAGGDRHLAWYLDAEIFPVLEDFLVSAGGADFGQILYFADIWRPGIIRPGSAAVDIAYGRLVFRLGCTRG